MLPSTATPQASRTPRTARYSLFYNTTGGSNTANGYYSLFNNTTGSSNTANGYSSLSSNTIGNYNTANGMYSLLTATSTTGTTAFGYQAGKLMSGATGAVGNYNTLIGYQAGYDITTGGNNLILGTEQTTATGITTGSGNIIIGNGYNGLTNTASNQLNIGNLIFGTGLASGNTLSTGNVGIGTTNPQYKLEVNGTAAFPLIPTGAGSGSICYTGGTGALSTSTAGCTASSLRFKDNIQPLTYGLADILKLKPVSFTYKPYMDIPGNQIGFIAEDMVQVIPEVVGYDAQGLPASIDYGKLTSVLVSAMQELNANVRQLQVAGAVYKRRAGHRCAVCGRRYQITKAKEESQRRIRA